MEVDANPLQGTEEDQQISFEYPGKKFPSRPSSDENYSICSNLGKLIIFNQAEFQDSSNSSRNGTNKDLERLQVTFSAIGYNVNHYTNLKTREIKGILKEVAAEDHTSNTSLIIVVLTHGNQDGQLSTFDSKLPIEDLWKPFTGDKCQTLSGKPKLFFIQACRGLKVDPGSISNQALASRGTRLNLDVNSQPFVIPTLADFLLFHSSAEGFPSFRNSEGSWFIQTLCDKFDEFLKDEKEVELEKILKAVKREVAYGKQGCFSPNRVDLKKYDASKQMPTIVTTLTKFLVLNKK